MSASAAEDGVPTENEATNGRPRLRLLLADDDFETALHVQRMLAEIPWYEFDVRWADGPESAQELLQGNDYDVVLLDHRIGGTGGLTLLRNSAAAHPDPRAVVLLTGAVNHDIEVEAAQAGVAALLEKAELTPVRLERTIRFAMERARVERDLRHIEDRIRFQAHLLDTVDQAVVATDLRGRVSYWNRVAERMFGWCADEARGKTIADLNVPEGELDRARAIMASVRSGLPWTGEFQCRHREGRRFPVLVTVTPVRDGRGEITGVVGMSTEITHQKETERALRHSQRMEAVGQLAAGVAHDFNNMLTVVRTSSSLIEHRVPPGDPIAEDLRHIRAATDRAAALTRQLLAFSSRQVLQPRVLDVNAVVDELAPMLPRLTGEDIATQLSLSPGIGFVRVDRGQLEQVVMNLAVNARDAMPRGGLLSIRTSALRLVEEDVRPHAVTPPGEYVALSVGDTGSGIPPDIQHRVFEPFFTTKGPGRGTGLGLPTVYGIVQQSGGSIWLDSKTDCGTVFTVLLPRVDEVPSIADATPESGVTIGGSETILLVEDDAVVRTVTRRVLAELGYTVVEAADGLDALGVAERCPEHPELLLSDMIMPGLSGRQLYERLKERWPELRVLYMSGYTDDEMVRRGAPHTRGVRFIEKPYTLDGLAKAVRAALDAHA